MKIKTRELIGPALDWAVAYAIGGDVRNYPAKDGTPHWEARGKEIMVQSKPAGSTYRPRIGWIGQSHPAWPGDTRWRPSSDWQQGGPLIARYVIAFLHNGDELTAVTDEANGAACCGETHLIAAMRTIVSAETGDEVEVPDSIHFAKEAIHV